MTGPERLLQAAKRLQAHYDAAKSDLERKAVNQIARELAAEAETALTTYTGFTRALIRKGLVTEE